jgi:hypothetical protein
VTAFSGSSRRRGRDNLQPVRDSIGRFRSVLIRASIACRRFRVVREAPHPYALLFAVSLAADGGTEMGGSPVTLVACSSCGTRRARLPLRGSADWVGRPARRRSGQCRCCVLVDAALRLREPRYGKHAATLVKWLKHDGR